MLNTFMDEVVAQGAEAVLPHQLEDRWLFPMARAAKRFLRHGAAGGEAPETPLDIFEDMEGSLFIAAITEILQSRYDYPAHFQMETLPEDVLYESIACYSLYLVLEEMKRTTSIPYPHPDPDTLLEPERLEEIEGNDPRISQYLYDVGSE
ncbi:hypothetical protein LJC24_03735 [Desulfococcaceae bacterium OttesenSCG-928-F15]|nr:hypothetical protein [Desulfococcaceae bacterium OttesenSCG-928-F15]